MPTVEELRTAGANEAADAIERMQILAQDLHEHGIFTPIEDSPETQYLVELKRLNTLAIDLADRRDWEGASIVEKQIEDLRAAKQPKPEQNAARKESFLEKLDRIHRDRQTGQRSPEANSGPISRKTYSINWSTAPSWAMYHTFDETFDPIGQPTGTFFSHRPRTYYGKYYWEMSEHTHDGQTLQSAPSNLVKPDNVDWKLSLIRRPDYAL